MPLPLRGALVPRSSDLFPRQPELDPQVSIQIRASRTSLREARSWMGEAGREVRVARISSARLGGRLSDSELGPRVAELVPRHMDPGPRIADLSR